MTATSHSAVADRGQRRWLLMAVPAVIVALVVAGPYVTFSYHRVDLRPSSPLHIVFLRFGPDGKLYASTGDAQNGDNAQNANGLNGKVLRLNPDGTPPADNPFGNYVWSYGHRNPQGLAFDSQGRRWEQEFGNGIMDETILITKGGNYGWPAREGAAGTCSTLLLARWQSRVGADKGRPAALKAALRNLVRVGE